MFHSAHKILLIVIIQLIISIIIMISIIAIIIIMQKKRIYRVRWFQNIKVEKPLPASPRPPLQLSLMLFSTMK